MFVAELTEQCGPTNVRFSTIMTAPMLVGLFVSFAIGTLSDRVGIKKTLVVALLLTRVGAVVRGFAVAMGATRAFTRPPPRAQ